MQIADFLYHKPPSDILSSPIDPSYFPDLKKHLDNNLEYRKARIEWRKNKPAIWDMWRIKEEFFQEYCETDLPTFHNDIQIFIKNNPGISIEIMAERFCEKWKGYEKTYGVEFVERAMRRYVNEKEKNQI